MSTRGTVAVVCLASGLDLGLPAAALAPPRLIALLFLPSMGVCFRLFFPPLRGRAGRLHGGITMFSFVTLAQSRPVFFKADRRGGAEAGEGGT